MISKRCRNGRSFRVARWSRRRFVQAGAVPRSFLSRLFTQPRWRNCPKGLGGDSQRSPAGRRKVPLVHSLLRIPARYMGGALLKPYSDSLRSSTLAIWPANTAHRLGLLPSPWDFLRVGLPLQHAKSPLKTWAVLAETF